MLGGSYPLQDPSPCLCGTVIEIPVIEFRGKRRCTEGPESVSCGTCGRRYHSACVHGSSEPNWACPPCLVLGSKGGGLFDILRDRIPDGDSVTAFRVTKVRFA